MIGLIGLIAVAGVFAQGYGGAGGFGAGEVTDFEAEGRLILEEGVLPRLATDGTEYTLRIAPAIAAEIEVTNGETVSVDGGMVTLRGPDLVSTERIVFVRAIEADGTRVVAPSGSFRGGPGMGHGMFHGDSFRRNGTDRRRGWSDGMRGWSNGMRGWGDEMHGWNDGTRGWNDDSRRGDESPEWTPRRR